MYATYIDKYGVDPRTQAQEQAQALAQAQAQGEVARLATEVAERKHADGAAAKIVRTVTAAAAAGTDTGAAAGESCDAPMYTLRCI